MAAAVVAVTLAATAIAAPSPVVLSSGHADVWIAYADGKLSLSVHTAEADYSANETVLMVPPLAKRAAPANPAFAPCLGAQGSPVWILPQAEATEILFLGHNATTVPKGVFVGEKLDVLLRSVDGPGQFCAYSVGAFGAPTFIFNTRDGISSADTLRIDLEQSHGHANWTFSAPGAYRIGLEASGTLAGTGAATSSGVTFFAFTVADTVQAADTPTPEPTVAPPPVAIATSTPVPAPTATIPATPTSAPATASPTPPVSTPTPAPTVTSTQVVPAGAATTTPETGATPLLIVVAAAFVLAGAVTAFVRSRRP